jgi:hypothetical protein
MSGLLDTTAFDFRVDHMAFEFTLAMLSPMLWITSRAVLHARARQRR